MAGLSIGGRGYPGRLTLLALRARRAVAAYAAQKEEAWLNHARSCRTNRIISRVPVGRAGSGVRSVRAPLAGPTLDRDRLD